MGLNIYLAIITLTINGLNAPIQRHWIGRQNGQNKQTSKQKTMSIWMLPTKPYSDLSLLQICYFFLIFLMFIYFWDRERPSMNGGGSERGRHRIWNRLQALSCQHSARRGARPQGLRDHDLSRSRPLNRLSHPGAPMAEFFKAGTNSFYLSFLFFAIESSVHFPAPQYILPSPAVT